jgi:hypothetical protein
LIKNPELAEQYKETFAYYPEKWISPFIDRRRENGWGLYGLLAQDFLKLQFVQRRHVQPFHHAFCL